MFLNLVRAELIRLSKNRFFLPGAFICAIIMAAYFTFTIPFMDLVVGISEAKTGNSNSYSMEMIIFEFYTGLLGTFGAIVTIAATTGYYRFREFINIRGNIRSRAYLCLTEIFGIFVFSLFLGVMTMIAAVLSAVNGDYPSMILAYPFATVVLFISSSLTIFTDIFAAFAISKLIRRGIISFIAYFAGSYVLIFLLLVLEEVITGISGASPDLVYNVCFQPLLLADCFLSEGYGSSDILFSVLTIAGELLLLTVISVAASRRKENL